MKIRLSCDDGCASDIKVAEIAKKYGLECTFYWPVEWHSLAYEKGYKPLSWDDAIQIAREFEIGSHTITHRHLTSIPFEEAKNEIENSRYMLECLIEIPDDRNITKFCPPRGYTNKELTEFTLDNYELQRLTKGVTDDGYTLVHVHPDSGANDNRPWQIVAKENDNVELWGHSWEWDKFNLWEQLEGFLNENTRS